MNEAACNLSARSAVDELRAGRVSPRELLQALRARIAAVDPLVNALPTLCFGRAEQAAAALEARPPE
jgi:amidase